MDKSAPLIELKKLHKSYFSEDLETKVLHNVDLVINQGELVSIMGPSGSGKSTLMHILGFLDTQTSGEYLFFGEDAREMDDDQLAKIRSERVSFVFQAFNLLPRTTVLDNVMLPLLYSKEVKVSERHNKAMEAIERVGLADRALYYSNQLSGGQQQRVAIARALVTKPDIIFADEPTGNLDSTSGIQVMDALQTLHDDGHTIILVTHETATAQYAERILHIKDGIIEKDDRSFKKKKAKKTTTLK